MNLLGLMTFVGLTIALVLTIKNLGGSQLGLIIVLGEVGLILFLSALKYYRDTPFWLTSFSFSWLWSIFKKNTTRVDIPISAIKNPVGNAAPGVLMNGTTPENSTVFFYKAVSGKSYLARDTNFEKKGGPFYEIISSNDTGCDISWRTQTDVLYTDLKNGGFFEYLSSDPKHADMKIMVNTSTVQPGITKYASWVSNDKNNFPSGLNYGDNNDVSFFNIKNNWLTGNGFDFDISILMMALLSGGFNTLDITFIINSTGFRTKWTPTGWTPPNDKSYLLIMNTSKIKSTTKYLLIGTNQTLYISNNGLNYSQIDPMTGQSMGNDIIYDYKTGVPPNIGSSGANLPITTLPIVLDTIKNPVGSTAPGVLMNENSTAFLYKAISGKSYFSSKGPFYEIISSNASECKISKFKQTNLLYTDLEFGGFFEYPSTNPKHIGMNIMMNTPTLQFGVTQYASQVSNNKNNFPEGLNYSSFIDFSFINIANNWLNGDKFEAPNMSDFNFNFYEVTFIIDSTGFRNKWTPTEWTPPNDKSYLLMMNTPIITSTTKYLLMNMNEFYISNNGLNYSQIDPMTGQSMGNDIIYDYKTGIPPNIIPNVGPQN